MKKFFRDFAAIAMVYLFVLLCCVIGVSADSAAEKVINGGFESGSIEPWTNNSTATFTIDDTEKHGGKYSLRVARNAWFACPVQNLQLTKDVTYEFEAWVKMTSGSYPIRMILHLTNGSDVYLNGTEQTFSAGDGWVRVSGSWTCTEENANQMLMIMVASGAGSENLDLSPYYVDDVSVIDVRMKGIGDMDLSNGKATHEEIFRFDKTGELHDPEVPAALLDVPMEKIPKRPEVPSVTEPGETAAVFYVSPEGSDVSDGSLEKPFRTLERARQAVRSFKQKSKKGDIIVYLREGQYQLEKTLTFGLEDSGNQNQNIFYMSYPNERAVVTSLVPLEGWVNENNEAFDGKLWSVDLSGTNKPKEFHAMFKNGTEIPRARSEGFNQITLPGTTTDDVYYNSTVQYPETVEVPAENIKNIELLIRAYSLWNYNILKLDSVDAAQRLVTTVQPAIYPAAEVDYLDEPSAWFENDLAYMDEMNEWVLDGINQKAYIYSEEDPNGKLSVPTLINLVTVEGKIDYDGATDIPVTNLHFKNISFRGTERFTYPADYLGTDTQHSWELFDRDTAALRFRGSESCSVTGCEISDGASGGLRFDLYAKNNVVKDNSIHNMGGTGIFFGGYGPGTKDVNRGNLVQNNHIYKIGQHYIQSLAIFLWQSGHNVVENNLIHDIPYTGIAVTCRVAFLPYQTMEGGQTLRWNELPGVYRGFDRDTYDIREPYYHGRENYIVNNEIYDYVKRLADGNGIYISGTGRRNVIANNYLHDTYFDGVEASIRTDDDQYDTFIFDNVIQNTGYGDGLTTKQRNYFFNNIMINLRRPNETAEGYMQFTDTDMQKLDGSIMTNNILKSDIMGQKSMHTYSLTGKFPPSAKNMKYDANFYDWVDEEGYNNHLNEAFIIGFDRGSVRGNAGFYDLEHGDVRFDSTSKAARMGIHQVDVSRAGLLYNVDDSLTESLDRVYMKAGDDIETANMTSGETRPLSVNGKSFTGAVIDNTQLQVTYTSDKPEIASVENGILTAKQEGRATVTAEVRFKDSVRRITMQVCVDSRPGKVVFANDKTFYVTEEWSDEKVMVADQFGCFTEADPGALSFRSDNTGVATIDYKGHLKILNAGSANIIATYRVGEKVMTVTKNITVIDFIPSTLEGNVDTTILTPGKTTTIMFSGQMGNGQPVRASDFKFTYESSDENVVQVSSAGEVTGVGMGTALVTVTFTKGEYTGYDTLKFTVNEELESFAGTYETIQVSELLTDRLSWTGAGKMTNGLFETDYLSYTKEKFNDVMLEFDMQYNFVSNGDWPAIIFKAQDETDPLYGGTGYYLVVKQNAWELMKFIDGKRTMMIGQIEGFEPVFGLLTNKEMNDGRPHKLKIGGFDVEDGVRIMCYVDDKLLFDMVDKENPITGAGYFGVNAASGPIQIR